MAKVPVHSYSSWGQMEAMANAAAEDARQADAEATIKRSVEILPEDTAGTAHCKCDQEAAAATAEELGD